MDKTLGQFTFDPDLGWTKQVALGARQIELVLGCDGVPPSEAMLQTARSWLEGWSSQFPRILDYIRAQTRNWANPPQPEEFEVESVNILWTDKPNACMIYFHRPGDAFRLWHITFYGFEPRGFAFDD